MLNIELRQARLSCGWSQRTLGKRIGVEAQTVKRLERGIGSVVNLVAAMQALDFHAAGIARGRNLPEQLRNRRLSASMSVAALAKRAGLSRSTVADVERGRGSVASLTKMLAALAPRMRRRAPERAYWGSGVKEDRDSRFTPPDFLEHLNDAFGEIDLDPCAHPASSVAARRRIVFSEGGDGLTEQWSGDFAFVNPPFSRLLIWLRRAHEQWATGHVRTVVCLSPVRTDSAWFHETLRPSAHIYFLRGRIRFLDLRGEAQNTPFSLMLVALGSTAEQRRRYAELVPGFWLDRHVDEADPPVSKRRRGRGDCFD